MNLRLYWHIIIIKILRLLFFCAFSLSTNSTLAFACVWRLNWAAVAEEFIKDMIRRWFGSYNVMTSLLWLVSDSQSRSIRWIFCFAIYLLDTFIWVFSQRFIKSLKRLFCLRGREETEKFGSSASFGEFKGAKGSNSSELRLLHRSSWKKFSRVDSVFMRNSRQILWHGTRKALTEPRRH